MEVANVTGSTFSMAGESTITVSPPSALESSEGDVFKTAGVTVGLFPPDGFALDVS